MAPTDGDTPQDKILPIMNKLKNETRAYHAKLESLPYFTALIDHRLPLACYVNQLRALAILHGVLEQEMANSDDARVSAVWDDDLRKLPLLEEDLAFFAPHGLADDAASIQAALAMTAKIRLKQIEQPFSLLGYLYVLEGSTLGNRMHQPDIVATLHLGDIDGCRYYSSYQEQVQTHWNQFSQKVNSTLADPALHDAVIAAAHEAFAGLEALYNALYPLGKPMSSLHVTRINPQAGNHPMPEDEREIQAALKASDRGWDVFPYYAQRYGERGKRFSDSDACWLVTLTALDPKTMQKQIDWICRVLATRGMPTIMMEQTLRFLAEELSRALPDKAAAYEKLRASADILEKARQRWIADTVLQALVDEFEQAVGSDMADLYKNTGKLLVAAVVDEKNGIAGTVDALRKWLTDKDRFSTEWNRAVTETINNAHRHLK